MPRHSHTGSTWGVGHTCAPQVFDLLEGSNELVTRLHDNTAFFRAAMTARGFSLRPGTHPIVVSSDELSVASSPSAPC